MEENRQCTESLAGKLHELLTDSEIDAGQFYFKEEMIEEVMQDFYKEIIACPKPPSPTPTPLPSLSLSEPSPSYSPNAKAEMPGTENGSLVVELHDGSDGGVGKENKMEGREDEGDFDDEWLARVLNWAQGHVVDTSEWF